MSRSYKKHCFIVLKWYYRKMKRKVKKFISPSMWYGSSDGYSSEEAAIRRGKLFNKDGKLRK
jgi:hypothetical protein